VGSGASLGYSSNSFKITTEQTVFALPEVGMGFFPDAGASYLLPRLADHVGTFLALTGKRIHGWDVLYAAPPFFFFSHHPSCRFRFRFFFLLRSLPPLPLTDLT